MAEVTYEEIKFSEKPPITMEKKQIRFGMINGREAAIKTWVNDNGGGQPEEELAAYQKLRETDLLEFTPEPLGLVKNGQGKITALAVEFRAGELLTVYETQEKKPLIKEIVDGLEKAVLEVYHNGQGVALDYKMLEPDNLGFDGKGLWFCCCSLGAADKNYQATVKNMMDYLRKNFIRE